ncbi:MAG: glycoside hydrolase [Armatimonadota bacterium]|nr:glycoside hydrolase [Armatimonadota bacterium]
MRSVWSAALVCLLGLGILAVAQAAPKTPRRIVWDKATLTLIQRGGLYGRMVRLSHDAILCAYESGGKSWVCASGDDGKTWKPPILAAQFAYGSAANPELLRLQNGALLLFINERPYDGTHHFAIALAVSRDNGATWQSRPVIYAAGAEGREGCWEPSALQLPSGEIQLFFANNFPYPGTNDQDISLCRSQDNGMTWSAPKTVSYRAKHRDGMPVPLVLQKNKGIIIAIEDSGLTSRYSLQPAIIWTSRRDNWNEPFADGDSPRRWGAVVPPLPPDVYAGAPYIRQLPSGATVLSCQIGQPGAGDKHPRMTVYLGDDQARNFADPTLPFDVPNHGGGEFWNSLFIKNADTVTAITSTRIGGVSGLWAIDGHVVR